MWNWITMSEEPKPLGKMTLKEVNEALQKELPNVKSGDKVKIGGVYVTVIKDPPLPAQDKKFSNKVGDTYLAGSLQFQQGNYESAVKLYLKCTKQEPEIAVGWGMLGLAYSMLNKRKESIEAYQKAIAVFPEYLDGYFGLGMVLDQQGQYDEALEQYKTLFAKWPLAKKFYNDVGIYLITLAKETGRWQQALQICTSAVQVFPGYEGFWVNRAYCLFRMEQYMEALQSALYAEIFGDRNLVYYILGLTYKHLDEPVKAGYHLQSYLKSADAAGSRDAFYWEARNALDRIKSEAPARGIALPATFDKSPWGPVEQARTNVAALESCLKIVPQHANGWHKLGQQYETLSDWESAVKSHLLALKTASAASPYESPLTKDVPLYDIGMCYKHLGSLDKALEYAQQVAREYPEMSHHWSLLAEIQQKMGALSDAENSIQKAISIDPKDVYQRGTLAEVLQKQGKVEEARQILEQYVEDRWAGAWILNQLGELYQSIGQKEKAIGCFQKAVAKDPNLKSAKKNLANISPPVPTQMSCPKCSATLPGGAKFCNVCGQKL